MNYKITFITGSLSGAGTDANVFIKLYGSKFNSEELKLNAKISNFKKGSQDYFYFETQDLGEVEQISIWHDNSLLGAEWYLNEISIEQSGTKQLWYFPVFKWIKKDEKAQVKSVPSSEYVIEVSTGNLPGSGSKDEIEISIIGSEKHTGFLPISKYVLDREFKTGHTNLFSLRAEDVGDIREIHIKSIDSVFNSNWFLSRVRIKKLGEKNFKLFPFHVWIISGKVYTSSLELIEYTIKLETGDVAFGGTDANVSMIIYGSKCYTEPIKLNELIARNAFEAGNTDFVKIAQKDLGKIIKIKIWHDEKWLGDGWYLNKVQIRNDFTNSQYIFPYYSWLDKSADPKSVSIELKDEKITPRPFYVIAHMVNTPSYVEEALDLGSNAVEFDITPKLEKKGQFSFDVFHGFRPDLDPDKINLMERSIARTDLNLFLEKLAELEIEYEEFCLAIIDCKLDKVPRREQKTCGLQLGDLLNQYYQGNYTNRINFIVSLPKKKYFQFFEGINETIKDNLKNNIGFDLSMENFQITENFFTKYANSNSWWGSGIASQVPKTLKHFVPQFLIAAKKRTKRGVIKKIYYWTLDDPDSMARILVTKLDGIIVNDPLKLLKVLDKNEFKFSYRLANRKDNPFIVF